MKRVRSAAVKTILQPLDNTGTGGKPPPAQAVPVGVTTNSP
jgi:hypothetical protein